MPRAHHQQLQRSLERLHTDLAAARQLDPAVRQQLRELLVDIERVLRQPPAEAGVSAKLPRLEALAIEFETEHPALAGSLRQLVDLLGQAGL